MVAVAWCSVAMPTLRADQPSEVTVKAAGLGIITYDLELSRTVRVRDADSLVRVVAANSSAALTFSDSGAAEDTLRSLSARPDVLAGALYDASGRRVAAWRRPGAALPPRRVTAEGESFTSDLVEVVRRVSLDGRPSGSPV